MSVVTAEARNGRSSRQTQDQAVAQARKAWWVLR